MFSPEVVFVLVLLFLVLIAFVIVPWITDLAHRGTIKKAVRKYCLDNEYGNIVSTVCDEKELKKISYYKDNKRSGYDYCFVTTGNGYKVLVGVRVFLWFPRVEGIVLEQHQVSGGE